MLLHRCLRRARPLPVVRSGIGTARPAALLALLVLALLTAAACGGDSVPSPDAPPPDTASEQAEVRPEAQAAATPGLPGGAGQDDPDADAPDADDPAQDATDPDAADSDDPDAEGPDPEDSADAAPEPVRVDAADVEAAVAPAGDADASAAEEPADEPAKADSGYAVADPPTADDAAEGAAEGAAADDDAGDGADAGDAPPPARPTGTVIDPGDTAVERTPLAPPGPTSMGDSEAILVPHDADAGDEFGWSADTDGVRIISGAPLHDDQGAESGVAYIFVRDAAGAWVQEAELRADDGESGVWFGRWAAIDGDVAVVGAPLADVFGRDDDSGAAYIFQRRDGAWRQTQRLVADIPVGGEQFGWNVAIDGDVIVVSASNETDGGGQGVYVFRRAGDEWALEAKLAPSEDGDDYFFGQDIDISGDTIVVGAKGRAAFVGTNAGVVFVFQRRGSGWAESAILEASDAFVQDHFGRAVAIAGDTIVVGAYLEDSAGADGGSVYVFERDPAAPGGWRQETKLIGASTGTRDWFGYEVGTDGTTVVVGAPHVNRAEPEIFRAGLVTVFRRSGDGWVQVAELAAGDAVAAGPGADFGWAVDVEDGIVVVGAWLADTEAGPAAGRAYVYTVVADAPADAPAD